MLQQPHSWPASVPMLAGTEKGKGDSHALHLATVGLLYGNLPSQGPHRAEHRKNDPKNTREGVPPQTERPVAPGTHAGATTFFLEPSRTPLL